MDYDAMAILKDAKNVDEAHEFIDFMMRPEIIAKVTNDIGYANANEKATPLVDEAIRNDPAMYPPAGDEELLRDRAAHAGRGAPHRARIHTGQDGAVRHTAILFSSWSDLVRPSTSFTGPGPCCCRQTRGWSCQARP